MANPYRISATSHGVYCSCQRQYWYQYIEKHDKDEDFVDPTYFRFGRAAHECLEAFRYDGMLQDVHVMQRICNKHDLNESQTAKVLACVRGYFTQWLRSEIVGIEMWIENDFMTGKLDAMMKVGDEYYIVENKFLSEISPSIELDLPVNPQLNLYASSVHLIAEKLRCDPRKIVGISYRVVRKPTERQKKSEDMLTYSARCTTDRFEWKAPLSRLKNEEAFASLQASLREITRKDAKDEYIQNTRNCVTFGSPCPYYSLCHGILYSARKDESFNPDLF